MKKSKHFISNLMLWFVHVFLVKMWCLKADYLSHDCYVSNLIGSHSHYGWF